MAGHSHSKGREGLQWGRAMGERARAGAGRPGWGRVVLLPTVCEEQAPSSRQMERMWQGRARGEPGCTRKPTVC